MLQELTKMEKKLKKLDFTLYNSLLAQGLWQAHYQRIELNVNLDPMMENVKHWELNVNIATVFLNIQTLKMI